MSNSAIPQLAVSQVPERFTRENFKKLQDFLDSGILFVGFKLFEVTFTGPEAHHKFTHNMGFLPKDVLMTSITGTGRVTFNQELTTALDMDLTVTDACVVRFLVGTFT